MRSNKNNYFSDLQKVGLNILDVELITLKELAKSNLGEGAFYLAHKNSGTDITKKEDNLKEDLPQCTLSKSNISSNSSDVISDLDHCLNTLKTFLNSSSNVDVHPDKTPSTNITVHCTDQSTKVIIRDSIQSNGPPSGKLDPKKDSCNLLSALENLDQTVLGIKLGLETVDTYNLERNVPKHNTTSLSKDESQMVTNARTQNDIENCSTLEHVKTANDSFLHRLHLDKVARSENIPKATHPNSQMIRTTGQNGHVDLPDITLHCNGHFSLKKDNYSRENLHKPCNIYSAVKHQGKDRPKVIGNGMLSRKKSVSKFKTKKSLNNLPFHPNSDGNHTGLSNIYLNDHVEGQTMPSKEHTLIHKRGRELKVKQ